MQTPPKQVFSKDKTTQQLLAEINGEMKKWGWVEWITVIAVVFIMGCMIYSCTAKDVQAAVDYSMEVR